MKKFINLFVLAIVLHSFASAQWPSNVTVVENKANDSVLVTGNLSTGSIMEDISWAANSSNACFPATQNRKFRGNHVFFATTILPHSYLYISATPTNDTADLSMYGYMIGTTNYSVVPKLPSCITCEADHKWDRKWKNKVQTSERYIKFNNPTGKPYNIFIGVTAPSGVTEGEFVLKVKTTS